MTRYFQPTFAAIAFVLMALSGSAFAQDAAGETETVKATHGDWDIVCIAGDQNDCMLRQIGKTADDKKVLVVRIRKLDGVKTQDGKNIPAAIQITTPLGTVLPTGVKVQIDGGEPRTGAFEVCVPSGCVLRDAMSDEFLASLKAGSAANMSFNLIQQGTLSVTISLKGFTKAFKAL